MKSDLFEYLYHIPENGGDTPRGGAGTPRGSVASLDMDEPTCLTLEMVLQRRRDGLLGLVRETPAEVLMYFVRMLAQQLANAWCFVVLDYMRKQKCEQLKTYLDDDHDALTDLLDDMLQEAEGRLTGDPVDIKNFKNRVLKLLDPIKEFTTQKVHTMSPEASQRYAERVCSEAPTHAGAEVRSRTPQRSGRSPSPSPAVVAQRGHSRGPSTRQPQRSPSPTAGPGQETFQIETADADQNGRGRKGGNIFQRAFGLKRSKSRGGER